MVNLGAERLKAILSQALGSTSCREMYRIKTEVLEQEIRYKFKTC